MILRIFSFVLVLTVPVLASSNDQVHQFSVPVTIVAQPDGKTAEDHARELSDAARAARDLTAQESMAKWTFWMTAVSAASLVTGAFGMFLLWRTLVYTRTAAINAEKSLTAAQQAIDKAEDANRIAKDAFIESARPWLDFEITIHKSPVIHADGQIAFWSTVKITNYGRSIASGVNLRTVAWPLNAGISIFQPDRGTHWFRDRYDHIGSTVTGRTVLPDQTVSQQHLFMIHSEDWEKAINMPLHRVSISGATKLYYRYLGHTAFTEHNFSLHLLDDEGNVIPFGEDIMTVSHERLRIDNIWSNAI